METNLIVTLKCKTKSDGSEYYRGEQAYDLKVLDVIIDEYRHKLLALQPMIHYGQDKDWYKDMYVCERYLFSKDSFNSLDVLRREVIKDIRNVGHQWHRIISIDIDGLSDWVQNGDITLGNNVICTDPGYDIDTWCLITLDNVLNGNYKCYYQREASERRIATIKVLHSDYTDINPDELIDGEVGVDSGMAGVFDFDSFLAQKELDEEAFCDKCFEATYREWKEPNPNYVDFTAFIDSYVDKNKVSKDDAVDEYLRYARKHQGCMDKMLFRAEQTANSICNNNNAWGYVSSSGYGDGGYPLYVARNNDGKIVGFKIVYIPFFENPDEQEDYA